MNRVAEATGGLHLGGYGARAKAALSCKLMMHRLLVIIAEGLLRSETGLEDWAVCTKCRHLVECVFI